MSMLPNPEIVDQRVIDDNEEIFQTIKKTLEGAKEEILIASAWFTDLDLFNILIDKLKSGIKVNVIIAENQDNEKLPFDEIKIHGGTYYKVKNSGYGIMHQKFCIVDKSIAIHGTYNYTVNARRNNHESVFYTTHKPSIDRLNVIFNNIIDISVNKDSDNLYPKYNKQVEDNAINNNLLTPQEQRIKEFEKLLNSIVEAEIGQFDRIELYKAGLTRSESCNGDFNTLNTALDTIYYNFISDIDITEEQKSMLLVRINDHISQAKQMLDLEYTNKQNIIKLENNSKKDVYVRSINEASTEIEKRENKIESLRSIDIVSQNHKIETIKDSIKELQREFIQPKHKLFDLIPLVAINTILFIYLFLFYSSAAYILAFSKEDLNDKIKKGYEITAHGIFESHAIPLAFQHNFWGGLFVVLFFIIPISFALANRFIDNKFGANFVSYFIGLFTVDFLVATLVTRSIQDARILTNETTLQWTWGLALTDSNFYLVFVLGAMGLLIFKFTYNKLLNEFSHRNPTIQAQRASLEINHKKEEIRIIEDTITKILKEIDAVQFEILDIKKIREENQYKLDHLPSNEAREIQKLHDEINSTKSYYENTGSLYISKVQNNNPRISIDALKDRINTFLEGWNDFLHRYFSFNIAVEKSSSASSVVATWLNDKLASSQLDSRVNN